jgi:hypothetical protein
MGAAVCPQHPQPLTPEQDRVQKYCASAEPVPGAPFLEQELRGRVQSSCIGSESAVAGTVVRNGGVRKIRRDEWLAQ